jgi:putative FmdB family regulatory protein
MYASAVPLFDYKCGQCGEEFEALVRGGDAPSCPRCGDQNVEKQISLFAVSSDQTRKASLKIAKRKAQQTARDKAIADAEEIRNHRH